MPPSPRAAMHCIRPASSVSASGSFSAWTFASRSRMASCVSGVHFPGKVRRSSNVHSVTTSRYCIPSSTMPRRSGATALISAAASSAWKRPSVARERTKEAAFSRDRASSSGSRNDRMMAMPPAPLSRVSSKTATWRTSATRARKALARSSEPRGHSPTNLTKTFMAPRLTPACWMSGLLLSRSARISSARTRMGPLCVCRRSMSGCRPLSFSTLRAQSTSSQHLSRTSRAVAMLSSVRSFELICSIASRMILFGSSIFPNASSIAFSRKALSSSESGLNCDGAVPSWYFVLQARRPGQFIRLQVLRNLGT
mmetsp:Transcript_59570/g.177244  ORF Transcript_59570/g.177244 Transcript_59570/m.177244 type:complete len:311 (-) Transcript_59570:31-963(-)